MPSHIHTHTHTHTHTCTSLSLLAVNPGGWAPPAAVRVIAKREITKFLKKFSLCVEKAVQNIPVTL